MRLNPIVLYCSDLQQSCEFYGDVLGLPLVQEQHGSGPVHYSATSIDDLTLEIYPAGDGKPPTRTRLELQVRDVRRVADAARAAGYAVRPMKPGVLVTGPDGVTVELWLLKDDQYWERLSAAVEAGEYVAGPLEYGPAYRAEQ